MQRIASDWKLLYEASPVTVWFIGLLGLITGLVIAWYFWYQYVRRLKEARALNANLESELAALDKSLSESEGKKADEPGIPLEEQKTRVVPAVQSSGGEGLLVNISSRDSEGDDDFEETAPIGELEDKTEPISPLVGGSEDAGTSPIEAAAPGSAAAPTAATGPLFGRGESLNDVFGADEDRRIVFIMDVSRSLTPAQLRLSKAELIKGLEGLPEGASYQVIFFSGATWFAHQKMTAGGGRGEDVLIEDGGTQYRWESEFAGYAFENGNENLPTSEWRKVNPNAIAETIQDVEEVGKSFGTTWHLPLTMAMNLEPAPSSIYFLTDGETARQDEVAAEMASYAKAHGSPTVHTIALMVPGASKPLHHLAHETGGTYSLIIGGGKVLRDDDLVAYLAEKDISLV